jgi:hypothetical protein
MSSARMSQVIFYDDHPTFMELGIMIPFFAMHTLAAQRGDGLHPELLALLEGYKASSSDPRLGVAVSDQHRSNAV